MIGQDSLYYMYDINSIHVLMYIRYVVLILGQSQFCDQLSCPSIYISIALHAVLLSFPVRGTQSCWGLETTPCDDHYQ